MIQSALTDYVSDMTQDNLYETEITMEKQNNALC